MTHHKFTVAIAIFFLSIFAFSEEMKFKSVDEVFVFYKETNERAASRFKIEKDDLQIVNIDGKGGDDILIINASFSGPLNGDGGGVFLCQGKQKDCADGYFCEADVKVFFEKDIKSKGKGLRCKK